VSTTLSFTLPAKAALAKPAPMLIATSATVTGASNLRSDPSGKRITGIDSNQSFVAETAKAAERLLLKLSQAYVTKTQAQTGRAFWHRSPCSAT
jgi:hypothetical protein